MQHAFAKSCGKEDLSFISLYIRGGVKVKHEPISGAERKNTPPQGQGVRVLLTAGSLSR